MVQWQEFVAMLWVVLLEDECSAGVKASQEKVGSLVGLVLGLLAGNGLQALQWC